MIKFIWIFLVSIIISCTYVPVTESNIWDFEVPEECYNIQNLEELNTWVYHYLTYKYDEIEFYRTPKEILERKEEDCDGHAILFIGLAYKLFGYKLSCVKIFVDQKTFGPYHKVVLANKKIYDPTWNQVRSWRTENICYIADFNEVENWVKILRFKTL